MKNDSDLVNRGTALFTCYRGMIATDAIALLAPLHLDWSVLRA